MSDLATTTPGSSNPSEPGRRPELPSGDGTVKGLQWKLIYANHRSELGEEAWQEIVAVPGAPRDIKRLPLEADVEAAPFNHALDRLAAHVGGDRETALAEIGRRSVHRWATMYRTLVNELQGRPVPMLQLLCEEVHPWFVAEAGASQVLASGRREALVRVQGPLPGPFRAGVVQGFVELTGQDCTIEALEEGRFRVAWEDDRKASTKPISLLLRATRMATLPITLVPVLLGTVLAWWQAAVDPLLAAGAAVAAVCLHLAANAFNDVVDHLEGTDPANLTPTPFSGGSRTIQLGLLGWRGMIVLASLLGVAGVGLGLALVWATDPLVFGLGLAGVALGYAYSGPPFHLADRGLGEATAAVVFGPLLTTGAYAVHTGQGSVASLGLGITVGLLVACVLFVNEIPDAPWDARTGRRTLVVALGEKAPTGFAMLLGAAFLSLGALIVAGTLPVQATLGLATLPLAAIIFKNVEAHWQDPDALVPYQALTLVLLALTGLLVAAGIGWEALT